MIEKKNSASEIMSIFVSSECMSWNSASTSAQLFSSDETHQSSGMRNSTILGDFDGQMQSIIRSTWTCPSSSPFSTHHLMISHVTFPGPENRGAYISTAKPNISHKCHGPRRRNESRYSTIANLGCQVI